MAALSNFIKNLGVDGLFRGGAINSSGALGSSAVVKGLWAATTAYSVGDRIVPAAGNTAAGGKFLICTTAGTSGSTFTSALGNPGSTVADGTVTWTVISGIPSLPKLYAALLIINKGLRGNSTAYSLNDCISLTANDSHQHVYYCTTAGTSAAAQSTLYPGVPGEVITDGTAAFTELRPILDTGTGYPAGLTEVSGGSYARVAMAAGAVPALADFAGTQSSGSTTASTGTGGTTSNNGTITFPAPTANWTASPNGIGVLAVFDQASAGNAVTAAALAVPKSVNSGDPAPSFAAAAFTLQIDN